MAKDQSSKKSRKRKVKASKRRKPVPSGIDTFATLNSEAALTTEFADLDAYIVTD